MTKRGLRFAGVVCALALALTSCVSPEELRREDEATCAGYGFHPNTDAFCDLSPAGELGTAGLNFVSATALLGLWGLLGTLVGVVLALAKRLRSGDLLHHDLRGPPPKETTGERRFLDAGRGIVLTGI